MCVEQRFPPGLEYQVIRLYSPTHIKVVLNDKDAGWMEDIERRKMCSQREKVFF